jgi:carotenoid cleavage dioxygenase
MASGILDGEKPAIPHGNFAPVFDEIDVSNLTVRGKIPTELNGTLYRNGPNPHFPAPDAHWFTGDGMIHAVTLAGGAARYRNRWVRTPKWLAEDRAGRSLYRSFGGKRPDAPAWAPADNGAANTHVVWHGNHLLALEESRPPTAMDPVTLATLGYREYGREGSSFTAHPKVDPATGEMFFFGYNAAGPLTPTLRYGVADAAGAVTRELWFEAPYASMVHDFIVTQRHILFPVLPLTGSMDRAMKGEPAYAWEPAMGSHVGVMPREGGEPRWFRGEACYVFHVMNAWEKGNTIVAEVMAFDEPPLFPRADGGHADLSRQQARLTRWTFDLSGATESFRSERIDDLSGEFPRIDDRFMGLSQRNGWFACRRPGRPMDGSDMLDGIAHIDRKTDVRSTFLLPEGDAISEAVFAPRGAAEGDGWLLATAWRAARAGSDLLIFDAIDIAAGPLASVELPRRVPFGFHGNFVSGEQLA